MHARVCTMLAIALHLPNFVNCASAFCFGCYAFRTCLACSLEPFPEPRSARGTLAVWSQRLAPLLLFRRGYNCYPHHMHELDRNLRVSNKSCEFGFKMYTCPCIVHVHVFKSLHVVQRKLTFTCIYSTLDHAHRAYTPVSPPDPHSRQPLSAADP